MSVMLPNRLTSWEEAEAQMPGCSAAWDVISSRFVGKWEVTELFVNAADTVTLMVTSDNPGADLDPLRNRTCWGYGQGWLLLVYSHECGWEWS